VVGVPPTGTRRFALQEARQRLTWSTSPPRVVRRSGLVHFHDSTKRNKIFMPDLWFSHRWLLRLLVGCYTPENSTLFKWNKIVFECMPTLMGRVLLSQHVYVGLRKSMKISVQITDLRNKAQHHSQWSDGCSFQLKRKMQSFLERGNS
jgi:hypothetical protein